MKKNSLFCLLVFSLTTTAFTQYGLNAVGVGAVDYIEIDANPNGSLDVTGGFTFEAWILNMGGTSNQKVGGKLAGDFRNGFIYGIQDLQVNFEVFDDNGTNTVLLAGNISEIGWTHVAGAYEVGGMSRIFINGELAGEVPASDIAINPNANPFRVGIAPWDINALGFVGYLDEVRYWQTALDEETIRNWMHKDVTSDHVNYDKLGFYHKYNETEGTVVMDESPNENWGIFSDAHELTEVSLPFKGEFGLYENDVQGIWNAKMTGASDIMSVEGIFFDTLDITNTVLLSSSDGDYTFVGSAPNGYDATLYKFWRVATRGEMFSNITFDLSPVALAAVTGVALLVSEDEDFSDADIVSGTWDGDIFQIEEEIFLDGYYYTLGFQGLTPTKEVYFDAYQITIFPNPNQGSFRLQINQQEAGDLQLSLRDIRGRQHFTKVINQAALEVVENIDLRDLPSGIYIFEVKDGAKLSTRKLMIE